MLRSIGVTAMHDTFLASEVTRVHDERVDIGTSFWWNLVP